MGYGGDSSCGGLVDVGGVDARHAHEDVKVVHFDDTVLCQDGSKGWNEWMQGKPSKRPFPSLMCRGPLYFNETETSQH
ncbi:hypothetical protein BHM03_00021755 [Ensete ventricosum]|nr:hypothetical protein BHM03_00021755 [Ensete ventricosum]